MDTAVANEVESPTFAKCDARHSSDFESRLSDKLTNEGIVLLFLQKYFHKMHFQARRWSYYI